MRIPKLSAFLLLGVGFTVTAELAAQVSSVSVVEQGETVYQTHCAVCHGADGRGNTPAGRLLTPGVRVFADPVAMARVTYDRMYRAIKDGRPGTAMAPWHTVLSDIEIGAVIDYIRTLAPEGAGVPGSDAMSLESGRRLYQRSCVVCHGTDGRADTEAARILDPPPSEFADPIVMARVDDGRMYLAITKGRPGTAMSSWEHAMVPSQIIDIMRYVRTLEQPLPAGMSQADLDLTVGRGVYAQHCVGCHGERGDGNTPLSASLDRQLPDFTDAAAMGAVSDDLLRQAIINGRPGTAMAPWRGVLNEEDIRRVILFIRQTFQTS